MVEGRITIGEVPVRAGWIEFHPAGNTVGNFDSAELAHDGSYRAVRVPVGELMVRIVQTQPPVPATYANFASPLRFRAKPGRDNRFDVDCQSR